jgi:GT2 family glycosyltransferase
MLGPPDQQGHEKLVSRTLSSQPSIGVVVTNYNTWPLTCRCLDAVIECGGADRIVVVDDASSSRPAKPLASSVELLINAGNQGLCHSLNRGVGECDTDIVVIFDSDAYPLKEFADALRAAFATDPKVAMVGFATVGTGGVPTASSEEEPDLLGLVLGQRLDAVWRRLRGRSSREEISIFTCAMAVRREAFLAAGGFDEEFDWLDLDHDLSMRLRRAGLRLTLDPNLLAFHEGGGAPQRTAARVARHHRNRWLLLRKHGKIRHPRLAGCFVAARLLLEIGLLAPLSLIAPARFKETIAGRWHSLLHSGFFK